MTGTSAASDNRTITMRVPITIKRCGGRKLVLARDGIEVTAAPVTRHVDNAMVKAIARAHRWRRLIESGEYASITELAAVEKINQSYVCRILRLTLLAPSIVEAILNGRQPPTLQVNHLLPRFPAEWQRQKSAFLTDSAANRTAPRIRRSQVRSAKL
jgi:hypothetical protein